MKLLQGHQLDVFYQSGKPVLSQVSFELTSGDSLGLVGLSGAGKTSLLKLCAGLYSLEGVPSANGQLTALETLDLLGGSPKKLLPYRSTEVSLVTEDPVIGLNPFKTIGAEWNRLIPNQNIQDWLEKLHVADPDKFVSKYPYQISGGEAQRLRLAYALQKKPKLLLAESPTANLDALNTEVIYGLLKDAQAEGMSIFQVDHDIQFLKRITTNILEIKNAQLTSYEHHFTPFPTFKFNKPLQLRLTISDLTVNPNTVQQPILDNINFTLAEAETIVVLGPSGSGKTTLAKAISGIVDFTGDIQLYDNEGVKTLERKNGRFPSSEIQYIWQESRQAMNPGLSVAKTLQFAGYTKAEIPAVLKQFNLQNVDSKRSCISLSTGQMQRLAIARALAAKPKVLVCDEVTANLDRSNTIAILELLNNLQHQQGLSIVYVTHNLEIARAFGQKIMVLDHGVQVEMTDQKQFFKAPKATISKQMLRCFKED